ncbi:MAG: hypothetical protein IJ410_01510 [Oscillospiraceae bacterium]|nr:hypothetical protein [Oscillospiraceae bacterium]
MKKKSIALLMAVVMIFGAVGATLAWLKDSTTEVVNTFTYGDINIELDEADSDNDTDDSDVTVPGRDKNNEYKMLPGATIAKDPKVWVKDGSEACWLFVEITKSTSPNFDDYMTFEIADGWDLVETNGNISVYSRSVASLVESTADESFAVLKNDQVSVKETVTKADFEALDADKNGTVEKDELPTLTFKAYAVQSANLKLADGTGVTTAAQAWTLAK